MKNYLLLLAAIAVLTACELNGPHSRLSKKELLARQDSLRNDLLQTDLAFSQLSESKGRNAAFMEYADSDAVLLRKFSEPVNGKDKIIELLKSFPDTGYVLTWVPIEADVALSGDLGYTFGTYTFELKGEGKTGGTYCTIWKRSRSQNWKFTLGTGNQGLREEDRALF